jgi:hypothetical protein
MRVSSLVRDGSALVVRPLDHAMSFTRLKYWLVEYRLELVVYTCTLTAITCFLSSCEFFKNHTNPIADWQLESRPEPQVIEKDSQDFGQKLPPEEKKYAEMGNYYKDGKGQHAIEIRIPLNGTWWYYVLIYDQNDKRIKTVKYVMGHYAC